jgi:hypothetical protein
MQLYEGNLHASAQRPEEILHEEKHQEEGAEGETGDNELAERERK